MGDMTAEAMTTTGALPVLDRTAPAGAPHHRGGYLWHDHTAATTPALEHPRTAGVAPGPRETALTSLFDFTVRDTDGTLHSLEEYRGKVTLVVNTASECYFRRQFTDLQQLHDQYADRGFTVLGFPCDQFRNQEPGPVDEMRETCRTKYGITFPMFDKVDVNGPHTHPLYAWLRAQRGGAVSGRIAWNFTKFLVDADGFAIRRYAPPIPPLRIARRIEQALRERDTRA